MLIKFLFILSIVIFILFLIALANMLVNIMDYPYYHKTYRALKSGEYQFCYSHLNCYFYKSIDVVDNDIIFSKTGNKFDIKLLCSKSRYIFHSSGDIYAWYWRRKLVKWFYMQHDVSYRRNKIIDDLI
jgi:hypothetical protein